MIDPSKVGTDWQADELDAIVATYFAMLAAELTGRPYVKAHHARGLMARTGRSHRSVEFKHMNLSSVLADLGLPTIRGYKRKTISRAPSSPPSNATSIPIRKPGPSASRSRASRAPVCQKPPPRFPPHSMGRGTAPRLRRRRIRGQATRRRGRRRHLH